LSKKVCVVEDENSIREILVHILKFIDPHISITEVSTSDEFKSTKKDDFDIIFLDCDLHGDRSVTCDFLFQNDSIRTVLITGDTSVHIPDGLDEINTVMYKPFTLMDVEYNLGTW